MLGQKGKENREEFIVVKKNDSEQIYIKPGEEFFSDVVEWDIKAGTEIVLSVYMKEKNTIQSACSSLSAKNWNTIYYKGECCSKEQSIEKMTSLEVFPKLHRYPDPNTILVGVKEIQIYSTERAKQIVLFGDSIIHMSFFSDALMEQLYKERTGKVTILNCGISGNRILHGPAYATHIPGKGSIYGASVLERFEKDCFECGVPEYIIFLEGTNDMIFPEWFEQPGESITAEELAQAVTKMIAIAHKKGSKFLIGTIMPYQEPGSPVCPQGEKIRKEFNIWIRNQKLADGILDFDRILADKNNPSSLKGGVHIGDWIHPNNEGGRLMAQEVLSHVKDFWN